MTLDKKPQPLRYVAWPSQPAPRVRGEDKRKEDDPLPPFDDGRKALEFALNASDVSPPPPAMTRSMAEGMKKARTKAEWKRLEKARKAREEAGVPEPSARRNDAAAARREARAQWLGVDRGTQAGLILREFSKLDRAHQLVLIGRHQQSRRPCACRAPCCSGWALIPRWFDAVVKICEHLAHMAEVERVPGKKGLSTEPKMRMAIVQAWLLRQEVPAADLAAVGGVTPVTAAKHRGLIAEWLEAQEAAAWAQLDAMFDAAGITGTIID